VLGGWLPEIDFIDPGLDFEVIEPILSSDASVEFYVLDVKTMGRAVVRPREK
jgi:hypothetical protein